MKQNISISQKQKQKFSAKFSYSMNMLHMSHFDFETFVDLNLMENPLLEINNDSEYTTTYHEHEINYKTVRKNNSDEIQEFDIADEYQENLLNYIVMQLEMRIMNRKDMEIIQILIESFDSKGYLREELSDICKLLAISNEQGLYYLKLIQTCEPRGVGARNLSECLLLQLDEKDFNTMVARKIAKSYLDDVGKKDYDYIAKAENISIQEVEKAISIIKSLNPIPANGFSIQERTSFIVPDAVIEFNNDDLRIELNEDIDRKLNLNNDYMNLMKQTKLDEVSKAFLDKKLYDVTLLKYCARRRSLTIEKLITMLVEYQISFVKTGDKKNLRPLRLVDIETMTGFHASTISRAMHGKYFKCTHGTYPFQMLVPRTYSKKGRVQVSKNHIKEEMQEMIRSEDKEAPYSDQQVYILLKEEGFMTSRRSIAQYREELCIPSSAKRKIK